MPPAASSHAAPLRSASLIRNLVRLLSTNALILKRLVGTNPRCVRLGEWPAALHEVVEAPDFTALPWSLARERLKTARLTKYCDFNLRNLVLEPPGKVTFEVRILPGMKDTEPVLAAAALFEAILRRSRQPVARKPLQVWSAAAAAALLADLPLDEEAAAYWQRQAQR